MDRIFISYRRDDTSGTAHRLRDALASYLGSTRVFLDTADLDYGDEFRPAVRAAIEQATVTFVVIGPRWLDKSGFERPRIYDHSDPVRNEILAARASQRQVIPILVDTYRMPAPEELPEEIRFLSELNAIHLSNARFDDDIGRVMAVLTGAPRWVATGPRRTWSTKAVLSAVLAFALFFDIVFVGVFPGGGDLYWNSATRASKVFSLLLHVATPLIALLAMRDATRFGLRGAKLAFTVFLLFSLYLIHPVSTGYLSSLLVVPAALVILWRKRSAWKLAWWERNRWRS